MKYRLHIAGPDDIRDFDDELEALKEANAVNKLYLQDRLKNPDSEVLCVATVAPISDIADSNERQDAYWRRVGGHPPPEQQDN